MFEKAPSLQSSATTTYNVHHAHYPTSSRRKISEILAHLPQDFSTLVTNSTVLATAMSGYQRVAAIDDDDHVEHSPPAVPNSPPPSFRSRASSRRPSRDDQPQRAEADHDLDDAFAAPSDDDSDDEDARDRRRLIHNTEANSAVESPSLPRPGGPARQVTQFPTVAPGSSSGRVIGAGQTDGVFSNISAKPRPGDDIEEKPPTYEQAAADATPPYWETTVLSPYHITGNPDDVFVDGLLVGSFFSFVWNALISLSFQLIGFLLTYLLHTTHAAKHGSRFGLGITLVQYGFQMRYAATIDRSGPSEPSMPNGGADGMPDDPNAHDFDPNAVTGGDPTGGAVSGGLTTSDWLSYILMIVGWFILIRAASDFMKARRQEALVRSSPDRGLGTAVVAEGERPETSV
ncbi:Metal homeostatis protein BSD2 [Pseudocercospora fuligena]|uniref:Metal homeostatis protein BSD2 n=1 Tax=Pseudocercospora fuligena TaxID=685502 RepID=A0A8H6VIH4_9PEZI|nr:Metal homeostatis protein BSD2 [Pseudocercospora fuligena]